LKVLLQNCIEEWYGTDSEAQRRGTEYISAKMVMDKLNEISSKLGC